jgi:hypothetical protein
MKKFFLFLSGCILTTVIFYSCSVLSSLKKVEDAGFICSNYNNSQLNLMNKDAVMDMVRNYYTNQYTILHNFNNTPNGARLALPQQCPLDSRVVFFSLDTLKKLIYFIEKGSKDFSQQEKNNLGVNFYFASYPVKSGKLKHGYSYDNRHTLVMLPCLFDNTAKRGRDLNMRENILNNVTTPVFITDGLLTGPQLFIFGAGETPVTDNSTAQNMMSQNNTTGTPPPAPNTVTGNPVLDLTDPH